MAEKLALLKEKALDSAIAIMEAEIAKKGLADPNAVASMAKVVNAKADSLAEALQKLATEHITNDEDDKFLAVEEKLGTLQNRLDAADQKAYDFLQSTAAPAPTTTTTSDPKVQLPQLKLQEFTGDVRTWLSFWAGFEEIHTNKAIKDSDKFQYLLQSIPASSAARKCIASFPVCGGNYQNAVKALEDTFGRPKMLVKVYVRDLLQLVIKNANQRNVDLVDLVPQLASQVRNLDKLGVTSDKCEDILYPVVESCLPEDVLQAWQRSNQHAEKLDDILKFLDGEVQQQMERALAKMDFAQSSSSGKKTKQPGEKPVEVPTATDLMITGGSKKRSCAFCDDIRHRSQKCIKARQMTLREREDIVKRKQLCFRCLQYGHMSSSCKSNIVCSTCNGNHFELMCRGVVQQAENKQQPLQQPQPITAHQFENRAGFMVQSSDGSHQYYAPVLPQQQVLPKNPLPTPNSWDRVIQQHQQQGPGSVTRTDMMGGGSRKKISLKTLIVEVDTDYGPCLARVFIDGGSEESYIEENTSRLVKHKEVGSTTVEHQIFGGEITKPIHHRQLLITLRSLDGKSEGTFVFSTIKKIANRIPKPAEIVVEALQQRGIVLHDQSQFNEEIHILIGTDVADQIYTGGFVRLNKFVTARETIFGWVASGALPISQKMEPSQSHMITSFMVSNLNEEELWSLEALGITEEARSETRKDLEDAAVNHFEQSVTREPDGRYQVCLPWLEGHKELHCNRQQAVMRLKAVTSKLKSEGHLEAYDQVFQQWLEDGVIEQVPGNSDGGLDYYMPHRHVIKEHSTTPVRPVFDASAKCKGGVSLNDCLEKGPNMLERIPAVMSRFRSKRIGVTADIKKAFLQMSVAERDRNALKFLWWADEDCKEVVTYRHARVVFGVKSSPFLLAITLQHHLRKYGLDNPEIAEKLLHSLYVDNTVVSVDSMKEAEEFQKWSQELLIAAKFDLRGWEFGPSSEEKEVPILGMNWKTKSDTLSLCLEGVVKKSDLPVTKRGLLAAVNSVFDMMGFASPFIIIPKLLFQRCCEADLKWDDALPEDIAGPFKNWKTQVPALQKMEVPRWMCHGDGEVSQSLHTFSDASGFAYSCCTFIRTESTNGNVDVQLVMSKSRVAPSKKKLSIPRLELMGCLIGVRMTKEVKGYLQMDNIPSFYWTDSSTALAWICHDKSWARFVQARVDEIRKWTKPEVWRHVPGEYNPADLPSRGCSAERLVQLQWWEGPEWLRKPKGEWPISTVNINEEEVQQEVKKTVVSAHSRPRIDVLENLKRHSNYYKSLRVVGYVLTYIGKLQERAKIRMSGKVVEVLQLHQSLPKDFVLSAADINKAEIVVLRFVQRSGFDGDKDPRLKELSVFKDEDGILRVRSQLVFGQDSYGARFPAVLPNKHEVVAALILTEHSRCSHAGVQTMLAILRQKYWILKGRRTISAIVNACGVCRRFVAKRCVVPGAPLPADRIADTGAFDITGVDLLGPLYLRGGQKIWVVLFTCAVFRCVHLEVTSTLSTEGFIRAFRRFVDRRGRPSKIYSDNGLNFVGCQNLFSQLDWMEVQRYAAVERIQWIFNPPTAAWWGGFWERLVGLTKKLLRRILGKEVVNMEEFTTILCDVESTLNQRPLGYFGDSKADVEPLCPAYFLKGILPSGLPEADVIDSCALNDCARRVQKLREELRSRFRKEYLGQLKHVAGNKEITVKPGDLVIVEVDDRKRIDWPLGLVKDVYPGRDGKVRTALVKTKKTEVLRPVQRLFLLETAVGEAVEDDEPVEDKVEGKQGDGVSRYGRKLKKPCRLSYK